MDLADKIIVVTGGEGLLGQAFVKHIRDAGGTPISADKECETDLEAGTCALDITDESSVRDCVAGIVDAHGRIDGWINNAYPRTEDWGVKFEDIPFESWRKNVDMHLNGYALCCQVALEQMKQQSSGSLINLGSIYGVVAPDFSIYDGTEMTSPAAYSAIKGGIIHLTKYLAAYYGPHGVRVNAISPGGVFDGQPDAFVEKYEAKTPLGRMARPDDIAPAAVYLLSDGAAYVTGHNLVVDGGWTAI